jgi:AbrB family looped-hinge helix DNA binding protein
MSKVTSKLQVTIPKAIAEQYGIEPGDEIEFQAAGPTIRVVPPKGRWRPRLSLEERLRLFDEASARQREREAKMELPAEAPKDRGWKREDLYERGKSR